MVDQRWALVLLVVVGLILGLAIAGFPSRSPGSSTVPVVTGDSLRGATLATRHLLDLGHRTVWHIAGPADWLEAQQRIAGWRSTLDAAGAPIPPALIGKGTALRPGYAPELDGHRQRAHEARDWIAGFPPRFKTRGIRGSRSVSEMNDASTVTRSIGSWM